MNTKNNIAVIKINPSDPDNAMDIQTNGVSDLDMVEFLGVAQKHFCQKIVKEAQELGCSLDSDFDGYIEFLRKNKL